MGSSRVWFPTHWILLLLHLSAGQQLSGDASERTEPNPKADASILKLLKPTSRSAFDEWMGLHERYVKEVDALKSQGGKLDLLVYGDSITEAYRGTSMGERTERWAENEAVWAKLFKSKYSAAVFSISGDKVMHLLWRLRNGEGPRELHPRVIMVMIGTNDVGHLANAYKSDLDHAARIIFLSQRTVLEELASQSPQSRLVALTLPPLQLPWQSQEAANDIYQGLADRVNAQLKAYAAQQQQTGAGLAGGLSVGDCTTPFLVAGNSASPATGRQAVNFTLIPDGVHPSGPGAWVLGRCMQAAVEEALAARGSEGGAGGEEGDGGVGGEGDIVGGSEGAGGEADAVGGEGAGDLEGDEAGDEP